jgi:2-succinyl-5-enolpyruvyl-6-hydroxy-3-cyclohexene-1-carboxylate synthase
MKYPEIPVAQTLILSCIQYDFCNVVISPGSRNVPLAIGFASNEKFNCYSIVDERSAAFFAIGLSQNSTKPTILVCTSGSALLNYYPAISEAYFSRTPLIVFSADRPSYKINIGDGQTINQQDVFQENIYFSTCLEQDPVHATEEIIKSNFQKIISKSISEKEIIKLQKKVQHNNETKIKKAFELCLKSNQPVHLNIPLEEPLYNFTEHPQITLSTRKKLKLIKSDKSIFEKLASNLNNTKKIALIIGVQEEKSLSEKSISNINSLTNIIVFKEHTSNVNEEMFLSNIDRLLAPMELMKESDSLFNDLSPDIIISLGGMIISKKIKSFLRNYKAKNHFHIGLNTANSTYYTKANHIQADPNNLFENLESQKSTFSYRDNWLEFREKINNRHKRFLRVVKFSDLKVFEILSNKIPSNYKIQASNSSPVRYFQLFDLKNNNAMYCNRGTSGIDGCTSTAIGMAAKDAPVVLVTGDLSFLYDMNALGIKYIPNHFRIIIINNQGGGIFKILPGYKNNSTFTEYIETKHNYSAYNLAKMFNFKYFSVSTKFGLNFALATFFNHSKKPKILEIKTDSNKSEKILKEYFRYLSKSEK